MPVLTEGKRASEFIFSEANGLRSRDTGTLITGQNLVAGSVLGKITASGKYTMVAPGAGDGSQTAAAVLVDNVNASAADKVVAVLTRDCELNQSELNFAALNAGQIATVITQLAAVGIIVRPAV